MPQIALLALLGCESPEGGPADGGPDPGVTDDTAEGEGSDGFDTPGFRDLACDGALPVFAVCPCDFAIDWSRLTGDINGEALDPTAFEVVAWVRSTDESAADVLAGVCKGRDISSADMESYVDVDAAGTTATHLSEMSLLGTPADLPKPGETYWLWWSATTVPALGIQMVAFADVVEDGADSIEMVWP